MLARLIAAPALAAHLLPLTVIELPMRDVYPQDHWAIVGHAPGYDTPDEDVYLIGRNLTLLAKAGVVAARPMPAASRSDRWPATRSPTRRRRSSPRWPRRCRVAWRTRCRSPRRSRRCTSTR